ncbi:A disintegrin and metalloproteinase with thrombospondin motifs 20, partial [Ixodes scapularis]
CSVSCGQGIATRRVRCLASSPSQEHLPDDRCEESSRPRSEQACQVPCGAGGIMSDGASAMHHPSGNFVEGPYKWRIGLWGTVETAAALREQCCDWEGTISGAEPGVGAVAH